MKRVGPLAGRRVVVTRATEQAGDLVERLQILGAEPIEVPLIAVVDASDGGAALRAALDPPPDWIVVTSANGAARVLDAMPDPNRASSRFAVVGPMTASVLERAGVQPDLIPTRFVAESLVEVFPPRLGACGRRAGGRCAVGRRRRRRREGLARRSRRGVPHDPRRRRRQRRSRRRRRATPSSSRRPRP